MAKRQPLRVGDRVKLTGQFLRSTGQYTGPEGLSTWEVIAIDGDFIVTNEPADLSYFTPEEIAAEPLLKWRRIHAGNLYRVGSLDSRNA